MKIMNSYFNVDDLISDIEVIDMYVKKYRPIRKGKYNNREKYRLLNSFIGISWTKGNPLSAIQGLTVDFLGITNSKLKNEESS